MMMNWIIWHIILRHLHLHLNHQKLSSSDELLLLQDTTIDNNIYYASHPDRVSLAAVAIWAYIIR